MIAQAKECKVAGTPKQIEENNSNIKVAFVNHNAITHAHSELSIGLSKHGMTALDEEPLKMNRDMN